MIHDEPNEAEWDRAIVARLGSLRTVPVETSRLEKAILSQIPRPRQRSLTLWLRPVRAAAASLALAAVIAVAVLLSMSGGPALASAAQMADMHQAMVAGRIPVVQVDSIDAANQILAARSPDAPSLPQAPESHVMACCMKSVHNKKVACVLLRNEGVPITMAVANASDMRSPTAPLVTRSGVAYRVQSVKGLSMVMTERDGRWLCLIGQVPPERLMDMAAELRF